MSRNRVLQHPDDVREDLNPDYRAGQNDESSTPRLRSAIDIKELHERYPMILNDDLRDIPIIMEGERLEQGAVYLDLRYPERGEFKAMAGMSAGPDNWYVPKKSIGYELWNLLRGEKDEYRLGEYINNPPAEPNQTG
ncbi:MAG: hypothetical protein ACO1SX_23790 [Actinomycetota bacterium]